MRVSADVKGPFNGKHSRAVSISEVWRLERWRGALDTGKGAPCAQLQRSVAPLPKQQRTAGCSKRGNLCVSPQYLLT